MDFILVEWIQFDLNRRQNQTHSQTPQATLLLHPLNNLLGSYAGKPKSSEAIMMATAQGGASHSEGEFIKILQILLIKGKNRAPDPLELDLQLV